MQMKLTQFALNEKIKEDERKKHTREILDVLSYPAYIWIMAFSSIFGNPCENGIQAIAIIVRDG